jgi:hypothetical protein
MKKNDFDFYCFLTWPLPVFIEWGWQYIEHQFNWPAPEPRIDNFKLSRFIPKWFKYLLIKWSLATVFLVCAKNACWLGRQAHYQLRHTKFLILPHYPPSIFGTRLNVRLKFCMQHKLLISYWNLRIPYEIPYYLDNHYTNEKHVRLLK